MRKLDWHRRLADLATKPHEYFGLTPMPVRTRRVSRDHSFARSAASVSETGSNAIPQALGLTPECQPSRGVLPYCWRESPDRGESLQAVVNDREQRGQLKAGVEKGVVREREPARPFPSKNSNGNSEVPDAKTRGFRARSRKVEICTEAYLLCADQVNPQSGWRRDFRKAPFSDGN